MLNILVCPSPYDKLQPLFSVIGELINIIKIIVPIILIVYGMLDFGKAVIGKDDAEIKKAQGLFVKRIIYGVAVFFVITVVILLTNLIAKYIDDNTDINAESWIDCLGLTGSSNNNSNNKNDDEDKIKLEEFVCKNIQTIENVEIITTYHLYVDYNRITMVNLQKNYKGNDKTKEKIENYKNISLSEIEKYKSYKGFTSKENKNTDDEYSYTYTFDMNKIDEKVAAEFNAYKDVVSQNDYFENYDYECEVQ